MGDFSRICLWILPATISATPLVGAEDAVAARTPFRSEASAVNPATDMAPNLMSGLEFRGVFRSEGETRVCFVDSQSRKATWLVVGVPGDGGIVAEQYDSDRGAVFVRSGDATRWFDLRKNQVVAIPIALMADGTVDTLHMSLTEKEKAEEARAMLGDILEVGRLGRLGLLKKASAADSDSNTSQRR